MKKAVYGIPVMLLALLAIIVSLVGADKATSTLPQYEIKWYIDGPAPQPSISRIEAAMDKLMTPINATINIVATDYGNYVQKMQLVIASGQQFDLGFTSNWSLPFYSTALSGAFLPLDNLLKVNAPDIVKILPQSGWQATTVKGQIYAIPNYQIWARADELAIRKDLADKYHFDTTNLTKLSQLTPFLAAVKAGEPSNMIPIGACRNYDLWGDTLQGNGFEVVGGIAPGAIKIDDPTMQVVNMYASPEYAATLALIRDWYLKGYIKSDAATVGDLASQMQAGQVASSTLGSWKPGGDIVAKQQFGGRDVYDIRFSTSVVTGSMLIGTTTAVSRTSKDPARALMFYNMLFKDKDLYNTLTLGQEGTDYKANADGTVSMIPNSGYDVSTFGWEFGNQFLQKIMKGQPLTVWDDTIKLNNTAKVAPDVGFNFDTTPVSTQVANVTAICAEYLSQLDSGSVDPTKVLPEFLGKLKAAGGDQIITEEQRQINAWLASKKK